MAFYNRVSDPAIGGTYMTMLNTISNLGAQWPNTVALYLVGTLTYKESVPKACDATNKLLASLGGAGCGVEERTVVDGYLVTCALSLVLGAVWYMSTHARIGALQKLPPKAWLASKPTTPSPV